MESALWHVNDHSGYLLAMGRWDWLFVYAIILERFGSFLVALGLGCL